MRQFGTTLAMSGSHGTGKTTAAAQLFQELKIKHPGKSIHLLCDMEAFCPCPINKETSEQTQAWLFGNQIQRELDAMYWFDIVVLDRTIIDVAAYSYVAGFQAQAQGMLAYAEQHLPNYKEIRFKKIKNNQHCYPDKIRDSTDMAFRQDVENSLLDFYREIQLAGMFPGSIYYA